MNTSTSNIPRLVLKSGVAGIPIISLAGAYYYRPLPDLGDESWGGPAHYPPKQVTKGQLKRWENPYFSKEARDKYELEHQTKQNLGKKNASTPIANQFFIGKTLEMGYNISRYLVLNAVNVIINIGMKTNLYNSFYPLRDERYEYLIDSIRTRGANEALLTVSNHCSTIDDPTLFGAMLPVSITGSPFEYDKIRWTLCSQEICFKNDVVGSLFGAGKVLPIKRGAGISQPQLHAFALKIASCEWVHIFPEGKIVQSGTLGANYFGTRTKEQAQKIGKLKWGVGKLIAHSPVPIRVIPFHHLGMEGVVPQKKTGEPLYKHPLGGCNVNLRVGKPIYFDDIICEYENIHGKLYKYGSKRGQQAMLEDREQWKRKKEFELYTQITLRIEYALEELERESKLDEDIIVKQTYVKFNDDQEKNM